MLPGPLAVNGYVLAGGKSSRMGQDKALLKLGGKPLVQLAVEKLRRMCADVYVLGNRSGLEGYAPLVKDLHEGCGPLGGIEAALLHSMKAWNLFMAVDMPFLPAGFLSAWVAGVTAEETARVALFTVDGMPQPALCLLHRDVAPFVSAAVERDAFKLFPALMNAVEELAVRQGTSLDKVFLNKVWSGNEAAFEEDWAGWVPTEAQWAARNLWFANLNTPEEFHMAETVAGLLEND